MADDFDFEFIPKAPKKEPAAVPQKPADGFQKPEVEVPDLGDTGFEFVPPVTSTQGPPKPAWMGARDIGADVLASGASAAYKGVPGVVLGGLPSVERTVGYDLPLLARNIGIEAGKRLDLYSPAEAKELKARPLVSGLSEEQKAGLVAPYSGLKTYKGRVEELTKKAEAGELPPGQAELAQYKPQTIPGKLTAAGVEGAMISAPGGIAGAPSRMVTGAFANAAAEAAEQYAGNSSSYPFWAAVAAGAPMAMATRNMTALQQDQSAQKALEDSIARGRAAGLTNVTPEEIRTAVASGTPLAVYHMLDPESQKLIAKYAGMNPAAENMVNRFNQNVEELKQAGNERISTFLQGVYNAPLDAPDLTKQMRAIGQAERDQVFDAARSNPAANAIPSSIIGTDLMSHPAVKDAIKAATEDAAIYGDKYKITPPKFTPAQAPQPTGLLDQSGRPIMSAGSAASETPGNLSFWQEVKRRLNDQAESYRAGNELAAGEAIDEIRQKLVQRLSTVVPEYKTALDKSSMTFMRQNAPEAGYLFAGNAGKYKLSEVSDLVKSYTPEQRAIFEQGVASRLNDIASKPNGVNQLFKQFYQDRDFQSRMQRALSPEAYNAIRGKIASEKMLQSVGPIGIVNPEAQNFAQKVSNVFSNKGAGALGAVAGGIMIDVVTHSPQILQQMGAGTPVGASLAAMIAMSSKLATAEQQRIAQRIIPKVLSSDPKDMVALAQILEKNPQAQTVFNRLANGAMGATSKALALGFSAPSRAAVTRGDEVLKQDTEARPQRASGGRIQSVEYGADALIRAADLAKKKNGMQTEQILSAPDEHVVKALKVANHHIEG